VNTQSKWPIFTLEYLPNIADDNPSPSSVEVHGSLGITSPLIFTEMSNLNLRHSIEVNVAFMQPLCCHFSFKIKIITLETLHIFSHVSYYSLMVLVLVFKI
jgi:hypothetical protein